MITPAHDKKKTGTRVAVLFDYEGKRVRAAAAPPNVIETTYPPLSASPEDDERSAIKQAIVRWLADR